MTGGDIPVLDVSYVAGQDLSNYQFRAVKIFTDGTVKLCGTGDAMIGILQNDPPSGDIAVVRELGHSKAVMYDASNTGGAALMVADSAGRLGAGTLGTNVIVAILADASSGGQGEIHDVSLAARTAQGTNSRAGQLVYKVTGIQLRTTAANIFSAGLPLGFTGKIVDMFATVDTVSNTSSATATVKLAITGVTVTGLELDLVEADTATLSKVITSTKTTVGANTFGPTDTLAIAVTQGSTQYGSSDTGVLKLYVVTN